MRRVFIKVHSGICDQIKFLSRALAIAKDGREVVFDTSWYRENGKDTMGNLSRAWEIPYAFPSAGITDSDSAVPDDEDEVIVGLARDEDLADHRSEIAAMFRPELPKEAESLLKSLASGNGCAVHVRRGDLAVANEFYGKPVTVDYVERACRIVLAFNDRARFFFFSDDPGFVRSEIVPRLTVSERCEVVSLNGSERGSLDLFLISRADYIIGSQGSFGEVAALLSEKSPVFVTPKRSDLAFRNVSRLIYLNEDRDFEYARMPDVDFGKLAKLRKNGLWKLPYKLYRHLEKILMR